jgi:methylated-DNA-[protein]-cysteine S-methyltransferase
MNPAARFALKFVGPVTPWTIYSDGSSIVGLSSHSGRRRSAPPRVPRLTADAVCHEAARQMAEYFAAARQCFDLPLAPVGTDFDHRVWNALMEIPFGTTCSYGELARRIGAPTAARAVGAANGRNPIGLVIPCHRVIGASGRYVGYGGGLELKAWLIAHEASVGPRRPAHAAQPRTKNYRGNQSSLVLG